MRFHNIDFLRFIFAVAIVIFHVKQQDIFPSPDWLKGLKYWQIFVDFFFVISGFLLFHKLKPLTDAWEFAKKRFFRLAPNVWMTTIIIWILAMSLHGVSWQYDCQLLRVLMLCCVGLSPYVGGGPSLGAIWYVSALFWVSLFYFYISKIFDKKYLNLIIWILVMVCYAIYAQHNGFKPGGHTKNLYLIFNVGICRALASMGLGYFISMAYNSGFLQNVKLKGKIFITILEGFLIYFLIYYLVFSGKLPCKSLMGFVVPFAILFYCMLIKQGLISKFLDSKILAKLGEYSYSIFMFHGGVLVLFRYYILKQYSDLSQTYPTATYFIIALSGIIWGIIMYYLFEKPITKYINKKLNG